MTNITNSDENPFITSDLTPEESESGVIGAGEDDRALRIELGGTTYVVTFSDEQWHRLQLIIPPKPKPSETDRALITADHINAVMNVWQLLLNRCQTTLSEHDCRKLQQTEEEHHKQEPHHWPLDGYDTSSGYLPLQYVAEAVCDYIATVFGRAFAGRELGWMSPTNTITAGDVLTATVLDIIVAYDLGTVTPAPNNSGGTE